MSLKAQFGSVAAMFVCGVIVAGAQQTPPASTAPASSQDSAKAITVTGCVQAESAVLKRNAAAGDMGMSDEFVLTHARLDKGTGTAPESSSEAQPPNETAVGTSGSASNFGKVYRVTGDKESELKAYAGQRVEIAGSFKDEADAKAELGAVGTSGRTVTGELTPDNTPEITITSIKPLGACSADGKH